MALGRSRRAIFGLVVSVAMIGAVEGVAHALRGRPPPAANVQRIGQCTLRASDLSCPFDARFSIRIPAKGARPRLVFLGGSTVRTDHDNFPDVLAELAPEWEVLNLGVPGYSTAGVWNLASRLDPLAPDLVVIHTGHNDYNESVFDGNIRAVTSATLPIEQLLSRSWIHRWLSPIRALRPPGSPARSLAVTDNFALRHTEARDARLRAELTEAVRASPAPVVLTTLFRNFDFPPTGVYVADAPACASILPPARTFGSGTPWTARLAEAEAACPGTSLDAFYRAHATTEPSVRAHAWTEALRLDAAPLRAPLSADAIIREVAAAERVALVDLAAEHDGYQPGDWFTDPLHTRRAGAEAMAQALLPALRQQLAP